MWHCGDVALQPLCWCAALLLKLQWRFSGIVVAAVCSPLRALQPFRWHCSGVAPLSLVFQWPAALCARCRHCSDVMLQLLQQCAILLLALQRRGPFTGWRHCSSVDVADLSLVLHHTALSFTGVALQPFRWHCSGVALQPFC